MNPVVGLEVSKGESQVQAFLDKGKPYGKSFTVSHTTEELKNLLRFLEVVEKEAKAEPTVILEFTGHYHTPVIQCLDEQNYVYILVNPLLSYNAKKSSLRKVKTDEIDAFCLCELFYKEDFEPYKRRGIQLLNLRNLTRQHETITGLYVQAKLQFHAILDQVFPEYKGVFGDTYSKVSLNLLLEFSTSESVLQAGENRLTEKISGLCLSRSERWARDRAKKLLEAANHDNGQVKKYKLDEISKIIDSKPNPTDTLHKHVQKIYRKNKKMGKQKKAIY